MGMTADQYLAQLQALLPTGMAWPRAADADLTKLLHAFADEIARLDARADSLVEEADPRTTYDLLSGWERVAGLPDACTGPLDTLQTRLNELVGRLTNVGGQSRQFFTDLAARWGFTVTITEYREWSVNDDVEYALGGADWNFAWQINAPLNTVIEWTVESDVEMPFAVWGNTRLECVIGKNKPAHTVVLFAYS